jgi:hypothetical protein
VIIPRHLKLFLSHCQAQHHPFFRFTKQYRQGLQQIDIAYTNIIPNIIPNYSYTDIIPNVLPDIVPDIGPILKAYTTKHFLNARAINDLIKDVLKNPAFDAIYYANEVDIDMLQLLQASVDSCDIQIIDMNVEGDGEQILELFKRPAKKVLQELMPDMRLAVCQHFVFHEYKDPHGNRLFAGQSNGSVSFQLAHVRVGDSTVSFRPVYRKCIHIIPDIMPDVIADIMPNITYPLSQQSVVSIMTNL